MIKGQGEALESIKVVTDSAIDIVRKVVKR